MKFLSSFSCFKIGTVFNLSIVVRQVAKIRQLTTIDSFHHLLAIKPAWSSRVSGSTTGKVIRYNQFVIFQHSKLQFDKRRTEDLIIESVVVGSINV